ncbi:Vacuolar protein-sorting-associated protein 27 [Clydaea vesicula]|uniref:Vacuolar protein sorting-associated protein 27 n=1 Tax=Clydaea vesicula TaxID=447962 RepID=A0AAD5TZK4_9FUNG|nr:Vacuolar protein-sorting-associated protein 27 [Clydaea vesicula]KAJ3380393.1 Vacuolar protein-sorting-associated protein 27 [Lobulomyces angularis]
MSFLFGSSIDGDILTATSEDNPIGHTDYPLYLDIADKIKAKEVSPQNAMKSLTKRLNHSNPNVQIAALKLTDVLVKNSGQPFLSQVATKDFMDLLVGIINNTENNELRSLCLSFLQAWALSFQNRHDLSFVEVTVNQLKREGKNFPPIEKSTATSIMIDTQTAPEWSDSDVCMRCRTMFTFSNRKHHCRNCGQTFCGSCSSKTCTLPHLGLNETEVRVCDGCFYKKEAGTIGLRTTNSSKNYNLQNSNLEEDLDLKRAIEASLKESGENIGKSSNSNKMKLPPPPQHKKKVETFEEDAEFEAAIQASLLESAKEKEKSRNINNSRNEFNKPVEVTLNPDEITEVELENMNLFSNLIERLDADPNPNLILMDPQIQSMFAQMSSLSPKLEKNLYLTTEKYNFFFNLNEKISAALNNFDNLVRARINPGLQYPFPQPNVDNQTSSQYYSQPSFQHYNSSVPPPTQNINSIPHPIVGNGQHWQPPHHPVEHQGHSLPQEHQQPDQGQFSSQYQNQFARQPDSAQFPVHNEQHHNYSDQLGNNYVYGSADAGRSQSNYHPQQQQQHQQQQHNHQQNWQPQPLNLPPAPPVIDETPLIEL